jgi:hypothetical protein
MNGAIVDLDPHQFPVGLADVRTSVEDETSARPMTRTNSPTQGSKNMAANGCPVPPRMMRVSDRRD